MKINVSDEKLAILAQMGDKRAAELLLDKYKPLVIAKSRRFYMAGASTEDVIQEGMIGLYRAIMSFSLEKNDSFGAFASMCIKRRIISALKSAVRKKNIPLNTYISLNKPVKDDDDTTLGDVLENSDTNPEMLFISKEKRRSTQMRLEKSLSPLEKKILIEYLQEKSYDEIAQSFGITRKSVDNAMQRIRGKLARIVGVK
ncbi:MAG: RNA polymerase sporulation sigma factor SigH [Clostridia bacterium]|nr:RNA polymerase sporulation sigma factor SigH [Clostridia bacterium]